MNPVVVAGLALIGFLLKLVAALHRYLQEPDTAPPQNERDTIRDTAASLLAHLAAFQYAGDNPIADPPAGGAPDQARTELKASYYRWQAAVYLVVHRSDSDEGGSPRAAPHWPSGLVRRSTRLNATERRRVGMIRENVLGQANPAASAQSLSDEITLMTKVAIARAR